MEFVCYLPSSLALEAKGVDFRRQAALEPLVIVTLYTIYLHEMLFYSELPKIAHRRVRLFLPLHNVVLY
jgi:hypothetical protein